MKRFLIILICLTTMSLFAQKTTTNDSDNTNSWKYLLPRHEIQLGFGDPSLALIALPTRHFFFSDNNIDMDSWFNEYTSSNTINMVTCAHSLAYKYRVCKWFWVGGTFTYTGLMSLNSETLEKMDMHYLTIAPEVRFSYLNKKIVTLYSGFNMGIAFKCGDIDPTYSHIDFTGQVDLIGVEVGTRWFGFFELGFGNKGIINTGVGYHFYNHK